MKKPDGGLLVVILFPVLMTIIAVVGGYHTKIDYTQGHYFVIDAVGSDSFGKPTVFSKGKSRAMLNWGLPGWAMVGDSVSKAPCDDWLYLYRRDSITGEYKLYKKLEIVYEDYPKSWFCE